VRIGAFNCTATTVTATQVTCNVQEELPGGNHAVGMNLANIGFSNNNVSVAVPLLVNSVSPSEGSIGGGLLLTINGSGLATETDVTICSKSCPVMAGSAHMLVCAVPASDVTEADSACEVSVGGLAVATFTYKLLLTPRVTGVAPTRGGTGGGTLLSISGGGFGLDAAQVSVRIAGSECLIVSVVDAEITCRTGEFSRSSFKALVSVEVGGSGLALNVRKSRHLC